MWMSRLLESLILDAQASSASTYNGACSFNRFLHDVTQRARTQDVALARHVGTFDGEQFATDFVQARPVTWPTWFSFSAIPKV
jgi:hypothetical protein